MSDETEPEKPKPPQKYLTIYELRDRVNARDKMLAGSKPVEEAVKLIQDNYKVSLPSALAFVEWLRGAPADAPQTKNNTMDRIHIINDPDTGEQRYTESQPGSIPPRPVR